jgi:hypothetical protein
MTKSAPLYTTTRLLQLAAQYILENTKPDGQHPSIEDAILEARAHGPYGCKFPLSALRRANTIFDMLHTDPKTKRRVEFGKRYSETRNKYAIGNVIKNAHARAQALQAAAEFAMKPIKKGTTIRRAITAPTKKG